MVTNNISSQSDNNKIFLVFVYKSMRLFVEIVVYFKFYIMSSYYNSSIRSSTSNGVPNLLQILRDIGTPDKY